MRILWIAPNGGRYTVDKLKGTGGWIAALETAISELYSEIELCITFRLLTKCERVKKGNVTYIPIAGSSKNLISKIWDHRLNNIVNREDIFIREYIKVVEEFKPDLVHIWGCEHFYINILNYIKCPTVVHIQGFASSYIKVNFPPCVSEKTFLKYMNIGEKMLQFYNYKYFQLLAESEKKIAPKIKNWIGRTDWDKNSSYCLSPLARYFHCDELMRSEFQQKQWQYHYNGCLVIQSTIGDVWYKGIDTVLKTAQVLKYLNVDFEWNICGLSSNSNVLRHFSKLYNITPADVNINLLGSVSGKEIVERLLICDVYVHPSHIENSSNAIGEAMSLGVPVVAEYVGGNPSMLKLNSGILVQPYDPSLMASSILKLRDLSLANSYSEKARKVASERHNKKKIVDNLIDIYQTIIIDDKK